MSLLYSPLTAFAELDELLQSLDRHTLPQYSCRGMAHTVPPSLRISSSYRPARLCAAPPAYSFGLPSCLSFGLPVEPDVRIVRLEEGVLTKCYLGLGYTSDDVRLRLHNSQFVITAYHPGTAHWPERPVAYRRALELGPHIDARRISARVEGGVLSILFPYRPPQPQPQPRVHVVVVEQPAPRPPAPASRPTPRGLAVPAPAVREPTKLQAHSDQQEAQYLRRTSPCGPVCQAHFCGQQQRAQPGAASAPQRSVRVIPIEGDDAQQSHQPPASPLREVAPPVSRRSVPIEGPERPRPQDKMCPCAPVAAQPQPQSQAVPIESRDEPQQQHLAQQLDASSSGDGFIVKEQGAEPDSVPASPAAADKGKQPASPAQLAAAQRQEAARRAAERIAAGNASDSDWEDADGSVSECQPDD